MLFCKDQCNLGTSKDLVCLLSKLVENVLIAYGALGSFSSFVILLYFAELLTTKSRIKLPVLSQDIWCLGLDFKQEPISHMIECEIKSQTVNYELGPEAL